MNSKLVIMFGPPGSGKGTQSLLLAEKKGLSHVETSKALESKFRGAPPGKEVSMGEENFSLDEQRDRWEKGLLCEDGFVAYAVKEKLDSMEGRGVIMDGYPRSKKQVDLLASFLKEKFSDILVLYITVDEEESVYRNSNRKVCQLMRHSMIAHPETSSLTICPLDGSPLEKRGLDDPEVIKERLREFERTSLPVVEHMRDSGFHVEEVDGKGTISDVFSRILKVWK